MVEVCSGLVLGVKRAECEGDCWKWVDDSYSVKEAYHLLIEGEEGNEECDWRLWCPGNGRPLIFQLSDIRGNFERDCEMVRDPGCSCGRSFEWEKVLEETKILSWRILRARAKQFNYYLSYRLEEVFKLCAFAPLKYVDLVVSHKCWFFTGFLVWMFSIGKPFISVDKA
ncbi:hypothetical protein L195_g011715 [Trifolium pratense]|uniref:Uncharacterized protein n=1 Tax=Trifolium pratense TaxID=57577 RepID=A0A2K3PIE4_TRIPR|nr:hypothetical protein L195_g011715 [Trifolium pratense]